MSNQPTTRIIPIVQTSAPSSNRDSPVTFARQDATNIEVVPNAPTSSLNPSNYQPAQVPSSYNHIRDVSPANRPSTESQNRPMQRKTSIEDVGDKVIGMLDEIERRVEHLREVATQMEQEREALLEMLGTMQMNKDMLRLGHGEREDLEATMNRLMTRCRTVEVTVNTPRNPEQQRALGAVNQQIEDLIHSMQNDITKSIECCSRLLNTCSPDVIAGPIDQKFQAILIECTAEDQKRIRRRLAQLRSQMERAGKCIQPNYQ
jgi:BCL2-associated athanogene 2